VSELSRPDDILGQTAEIIGDFREESSAAKKKTFSLPLPKRSANKANFRFYFVF